MAVTQRIAARSVRPMLAFAIAALLLVASAAPSLAAAPGPSRIDLPDGWAPEGITAGPGTTVFVGSLSASGIWRGDVRTGQGAVIPGTEGTFGVGTEYEADANRLWVAGGPTGQVKVFDATSGELLQTYTFSPAGFLNDLVVTDDAVYVTDSSFAWLDVIPFGPNDSLADPSDAFMLPLGGDFTLAPGFNLNGIVAARGWLIAVQSNTGELFRIDPATGDATSIALGAGVDVVNGDGLELHGGRTLYVVQNQNNRIERFALGPGLTSATLQAILTPAGLDIPTTAAWVGGNLYVVNARFTTPVTPQTEYWITRAGR
jgi:streptogramin lyase